MTNQDKKRFYPLRDTKNPLKVTLVPITEEQYHTLYPEIWRIRNREQYHHRCMCPYRFIWKCDGDCLDCEYHAAGDMPSLDEPTTDGNGNMYDYLPDSTPLMENVITGRMLLEKLFSRLRELDPDADRIIQLWKDNPKGISDRKIAKTLGRPQRTFADQMKKIRTELWKIRGDK